MNDLISRQAAIDEAEEWIEAVYCGHDEQRERDAIKHVINGIKKLPSAQPEIVRCKDCKNSEQWYKDRRRCFLWNEDGVSVWDSGYCNYAERRTDGM